MHLVCPPLPVVNFAPSLKLLLTRSWKVFWVLVEPALEDLEWICEIAETKVDSEPVGRKSDLDFPFGLQ